MNDHLTLVTPLVLTYNEEVNIGRALEGLCWARRIVVVDSFSTDRTLEIVSAYPQVDLVQHVFQSHAIQWNRGLSLIPNGWVLSLDADYIISSGLRAEIHDALHKADEEGLCGFRIPFRYCVFGRPLRGTVLPPRLALFRSDAGHYVDDGHTQDLVLLGQCGLLNSPILHDDRKPLNRWLWSQERYLKLEVAKLLNTPQAQLGLADRVRQRHVIAPFAMALMCLIWHRGLLDGWRGWFYAFQRMYVEILLSLMLWESRHGS